MAHLLLIESDPDHRTMLSRVLERAGFAVTHGNSDNGPSGEALSGIDAILAEAGILERFEALRQLSSAPLIVVDRNADIRQAVRAMKLGAADYLEAPLRPNELLAAIGEALSARAESSPASVDANRPFRMIGASQVMCDLRNRIDKVAPTDAAVLIEGELGTDKELVARALHAGSRRCLAPLITVNCAAIPESLIERELFGHSEVASGRTGGLLEAADGGTLFLDEVGELPLPAQARLLRFLTNGERSPQEAGTSSPSNIRVVAASHLDLRQLTANGRFREDLYYRLNVVSLTIPPLRDRNQDILELADYILAQVCGLLGKAGLQLTADARDAIAGYHWPGNVRELENVIERAAILCDGGMIESGLLAIDTRPREEVEEPRPGPENVSLEEYFVRFVQENQDHLTETELAERLGISRKSLWERRQRLGIPRRKTQKRGPRRA